MAWSKESSHSRGYGAAWVKKRKFVLARDNGLCVPCGKSGRLTIATEVDHIVSKANGKRKGMSDAVIESDTNLQSICNECHKAKTLQEEGKSVPKPKKTVGSDGWPS